MTRLKSGSRRVPNRKPTRAKRGKQIHGHSILAQQGVNLIATAVADMGFMWTPTTGSSDAGIDGFIEIRNSETGEATNLIVQVQSKATGREWENETADGFWFRCGERDLDYWLQGNAPVILVASRPSTGEAYWVSIKDYFADLERRKAKKVFFEKNADAFTANCGNALMALARPKGSGLYLAAPPISESLRLNLLPIGRYAQTIYFAETPYREREPVLTVLRDAGLKGANAFMLKDGKLFTFHDLHISPWLELCSGKIENLDSDDWALSRDPVKQGNFVRLLNGALRAFLGGKGIWFYQPRNGYGYFYFAPSRDPNTEVNGKAGPNGGTDVLPNEKRPELPPKIIRWKSRKENERTVFKAYYGKKDPTRIVYYRHLGFEPRFRRFGLSWYLEVTPTYHFTSDGNKVSNFAESYLSGIKRIEKHAAVHADLRFWGYILTDRGLFTKSVDFLTLCEPLTFPTDFGIPEEDWLGRADEEEKARLTQSDDPELPLFE